MKDIPQFLRKLADLIALAQEPEKSDNEDHFEDHVAAPTTAEPMVPPLQQKIEIMKKIAGIDSVYDDDEEKECNCEGECVCEVPQQEDEMEVLKKNAGLIVDASDDFPE